MTADGAAYTDAEIEAAWEWVRRDREAQGLPMAVTDPAALLPIARALNRPRSDTPLDNDALGAELPS